MFVEVSVTRHTKVGTFRPNVVYSISAKDPKRIAFVKKAAGAEGTVFKILTAEQAKARQKEIVEIQARPDKAKLPADQRSQNASDAAEMAVIIQEQADEIATYKVDATQTALDLESKANEVAALTAANASHEAVNSDLKTQLEAATLECDALKVELQSVTAERDALKVDATEAATTKGAKAAK